MKLFLQLSRRVDTFARILGDVARRIGEVSDSLAIAVSLLEQQHARPTKVVGLALADSSVVLSERCVIQMHGDIGALRFLCDRPFERQWILPSNTAGVWIRSVMLGPEQLFVGAMPFEAPALNRVLPVVLHPGEVLKIALEWMP